MRGNYFEMLREVHIRKYSWCDCVMLGCPQPRGCIPQLGIKHSAVCQAFPSGPPASEESPVCAVPFHFLLLILTGLILESDRDKQQQRQVGCADGDSISKSSSPWYFLLSALSRCVCAALQSSFTADRYWLSKVVFTVSLAQLIWLSTLNSFVVSIMFIR